MLFAKHNDEGVSTVTAIVFRHLLKRLGLELGATDFKTLWRCMDSDHDGFLTPCELAEALKMTDEFENVNRCGGSGKARNTVANKYVRRPQQLMSCAPSTGPTLPIKCIC